MLFGQVFKSSKKTKDWNGVGDGGIWRNSHRDTENPTFCPCTLWDCIQSSPLKALRKAEKHRLSPCLLTPVMGKGKATQLELHYVGLGLIQAASKAVDGGPNLCPCGL